MKYIFFVLIFTINTMNNDSIEHMMDHYKENKSLKDFTSAHFNEEAKKLVREIDMVLIRIDECTNTPDSDTSNDEIFEEADLLQLKLEELFDQFVLVTSKTNKGRNERKSW